MKLCISAVENSLDAQLDPRFGRCPYFVIVDSEIMHFEAALNMTSGEMSGTGIQAAQTIASKGVKVLITSSIGPNAFQVLSSAGVKVATGASGIVRDVVEKYEKGELKERSSPTVRGHFGISGRRGRRR